MDQKQTFTSEDEALARAHRALLGDLRTLEKAIQASSSEALAEVAARLVAARTDITEHFRFEEQNGYLAKVRKREPRLERAIRHLAEEHRELAQSLDSCIEQAAAATSLNDTLRGEIRGWIERVYKHETRENDVVQDAFNLDISAED
jgi:hypothetical protein